MRHLLCSHQDGPPRGGLDTPSICPESTAWACFSNISVNGSGELLNPVPSAHHKPRCGRGPTDTPTPPLAPARSPETGDSSLDDPCLPSGRQGHGWGWGQLLQASLLARADPSHALSLLLCPGVCRWLWAAPVGRCKPARESALPAGAHPDQHRGSGCAI